MGIALSEPGQPDNQRPLHPLSADESAGESHVLTDSELFIRRAFDQNPVKGYELLFNRYYAPLCSHAARFVYDRQVAEDVVVDVFAQFWQKRLDQSITFSFRAYLFTMVRHRAFAHLRQELGREIPTETLPDTESAETLPTPLQVLQFNELHLKINEIIRSASPHSQKVFVMSRFEGKKNGQIADELNLSIKTVEGHITKVISLLRQVLQQDGLMSLCFVGSSWLTAQGVNTGLTLIALVSQRNV
jgi:RNA polymerase sigma-70 factor (family 1)